MATRDEQTMEKLRTAVQLFSESVDVDTQVRGGIPVLKGTRISIGQLLADIADDRRMSEVADDWGVDIDTFRNLLESLAISLDIPPPKESGVSFERELEVYRSHIDEMLGVDDIREGWWTVIQGVEILGVWPTFEEALKAGYDRYGLGGFMVRQVERVETIHRI